MKICSVENCCRTAIARGWCSKHYARWKRLGTTTIIFQKGNICSIEECNMVVVARGWCDVHYRHWLHNGDPLVLMRIYSYEGAVCSVDDCENTIIARGWCVLHYQRWQRYGDPTTPIIPKPVKMITCIYPGCTNKAVPSRSLCTRHRSQISGPRRRARELDAFIQNIDRDLLFDVYNGHCYLCGWELDPDDWELEHIQPLSKGGKHAYHNVAPAHTECNRKKCAKTLIQLEESR